MSQQLRTPRRSAEHTRQVETLLDSLLQLLYSLTLLAEGGRRMAKVGNLNQADVVLTELGQVSQQALHELRQLIDELGDEPIENEHH